VSIQFAVKQKEQEGRIAKIEQDLERLLKSNVLQKEIDLLKSRLAALEQRPKPGRPPKEQNG
jgi:polyhydroxyalkanoate synthesis regulator phasin